MSRAFTANFGLRSDRYSLASSHTHFSPRVNAAYRLGRPGVVLHASYDRFFAPPPVENILISSAGLTRFLQGFAAPLPALQPVRENQFELGVSRQTGAVRTGLTGYYRTSRNPLHTVLFPDSRIYAYANFDKGKAYGLESRLDLALDDRRGISGYINYALSRVYLSNPVRAGFVADTHHLEEPGRFLAPMDQTHTFSSGTSYRHRRTGLWASTALEYGSGTPLEPHDEETTSAAEPMPARVPGHFTQNLTIGMDVLRRTDRPRMALQFNVENLTNNVYKVSQESTFSPGEYFHPRFVSGSLKIRF